MLGRELKMATITTWIIPICSIDRKSSLGWGTSTFQEQGEAKELQLDSNRLISFVLLQYLKVKRTAVDKLLIPGLVLGQGI